MYITILSTATLHQSCRGRHIRVDRILSKNDEEKEDREKSEVERSTVRFSLAEIPGSSLFREDVSGKCNYLSNWEIAELLEVLTC